VSRNKLVLLLGVLVVAGCNQILGNEVHHLADHAAAGSINGGGGFGATGFGGSSGTPQAGTGAGEEAGAAGATDSAGAAGAAHAGAGGVNSNAGSTNGGDAGSTAGASSCDDNASCYDGSPSDTFGAHSLCQKGTLSCTASSPQCTGEVLPSVELCGGANDANDENCDGKSTCTGSVESYALYRDGVANGPLRVRHDKLGNEYWLGGYFQPFSIGTVNLPGGGEQGEIFIAKRDAKGNVLWAKGITGLGWQFPADLVVHANGDFTISGIFSSADGEDFEVAGTKLATPNIGEGSAFIARFDTNGNALWADELALSAYGAFKSNTSLALAENAEGGVYAWFTALESISVNHGGTSKSPALTFGDTSGAESFVYLLSFGADGALHASLAGGFAQFMTTGDIVATPAGTVYGVGYHEGTVIDFGNLGNNAVSATGFLLKVDAPPSTGKWVAGRTAEIARLDGLSPMRLALDNAGNTYLGASQTSPAALLVGRWTSLGGNDWLHAVTGGATASAVTVDPAGYVTVAGYCHGVINFDLDPGNSTPPTTTNGACAAKYDGNGGKYLWAEFFGQTSQSIIDVNADAFGNLHALGTLHGEFNPMNGSSKADSGSSTGVLKVELYP